jgi:hypothetical protein
MDESAEETALRHGHEPDAQEENDLDNPKKEIDTGRLDQEIATGKNEDQDIRSDQKLTPEIDVCRFLVAEMAYCMRKDQKARDNMEPGTGSFQFFEGRMDDG